MHRSVLGASKHRLVEGGTTLPLAVGGVCGRAPYLPPTHHRGATGLVFVSTVPLHQLIQTESPREGTVTWKTYHTYIKASGGLV